MCSNVNLVGTPHFIYQGLDNLIREPLHYLSSLHHQYSIPFWNSGTICKNHFLILMKSHILFFRPLLLLRQNCSYLLIRSSRTPLIKKYNFEINSIGHSLQHRSCGWSRYFICHLYSWSLPFSRRCRRLSSSNIFDNFISPCSYSSIGRSRNFVIFSKFSTTIWAYF